VISRRTWCLVAFALLGCGRARVDAPTGPRARVISQVVLAD
jgi:hypothetical protein